MLGWPIVAAAGYGILYFMANRAVYYPMKYPQGFWEMQPELGASDVWLRTSDGVRVHGWWVEQAEAQVATLFLHGNAGNLTHRLLHIREITAAGSSLLIIDYRGYGKSEGRPTEKGLYADADAAYQYLKNTGYDAERIVAHGESLGTAVAVNLAARRKCGGVVLEAPFTSARDIAARVLPVIGPMVMWGFDSKGKVGGIGAPVLILHGERDEVIPFELGRGLYAAAREPKSFWAVPGAGHNDIVEAAGARYRERLREFYQGVRKASAGE
jgi:fermentation-respiration switch protein FrsA (DUF1100 family)